MACATACANAAGSAPTPPSGAAVQPYAAKHAARSATRDLVNRDDIVGCKRVWWVGVGAHAGGFVALGARRYIGGGLGGVLL